MKVVPGIPEFPYSHPPPTPLTAELPPSRRRQRHSEEPEVSPMQILRNKGARDGLIIKMRSETFANLIRMQFLAKCHSPVHRDIGKRDAAPNRRATVNIRKECRQRLEAA